MVEKTQATNTIIFLSIKKEAKILKVSVYAPLALSAFNRQKRLL